MAVLGRSQPLQAIISQGAGIPPGSLVDVEARPPAPVYRKTFQPIIGQGVGAAPTVPTVPATVIVKADPPAAVWRKTPAAWTTVGTAAPVVPAPVMTVPVTVYRKPSVPTVLAPVLPAVMVPGVAPPPLLLAAPTKLPKMVPPILLGSHEGVVPPPPVTTLSDVDWCLQMPVVGWLAGVPFSDWGVDPAATNWTSQEPGEDC